MTFGRPAIRKPSADSAARDLNVMVAEGLSVSGVVLGVLMIVRTITGVTLLGYPVMAVVPLYSSIPIVALLSMPFLLRSGRRDWLLDHLAGYSGTVASLAVLNPLLGMYFVHHRVYPSLDLIICIVAVAGVLAHRGWSLGILGLTSAAWIGAALLYPPPIPLARFVLEVLTIDTVAIVVYGARMRALRRQEAVAADLRRLAGSDPLTGLLNERGLVTAALPAIGQGPAAVVYLDLDGLKQLNDREGHWAGNRLLTRAGQVLRSATGSSALTARLGGDEFVAVLPGVGADEVSTATAPIAAALRHAGIKASLGAAAASAVPDEAAFTDLLAEADRIMYLDKAARRGETALP